MIRVFLFWLLPLLGFTSSLELVVSTDTTGYYTGDTINITISAYNPTSETIVLNFGSGLQAGYFIGPWDSAIAYAGIGIPTQATIPPGTTQAWFFDHRLDDYPFDPGAYPIVAYLEEQHFTLSPPHYITIENAPMEYPAMGFYPYADSLAIPAHCIYVTYSVDTSTTANSVQVVRFKLDSYYVLIMARHGELEMVREVQEWIMYVADPENHYDLNLFWQTDTLQYPIEIADDQWIGAPGGWTTLNLEISQAGLPIDTLSQPIFHDVQMGLPNHGFVPGHFELLTYPNPFNPSTTIRYVLPEDANVSLIIYDIRGNVVRTLESGTRSAGWYEFTWDGRSDDGQSISTGLYLARIGAGDRSEVIKMVMIK